MSPVSILDSIGSEIVGVMSPVSICMLAVVLIVYSLSSAAPASVNLQIRTAANLVYDENPGDSILQKLEGSVLNALVFVAIVGAATFLLVLLYYYGFTGFLRNYTRFSAFFVLSTMGGSVFLALVQRFSVPVDVVTALVLLLNFSAVGVLSLFSNGFPILLQQGYMVSLAVFVATWFTKLPEWTTWTLLVALALYDLVAVLAPGGPLKMLVELASSREEDLPALIYEARPATLPALRSALAADLAGSVELQSVSLGGNEDEGERSPLVNPVPDFDNRSRGSSNGISPDTETEIETDMEMSPLVETTTREAENQSEYESARSGGIKLGLGDFIFYSVLVGRAAMFDLMTVYACYLAIISGLGCTLILLSVHKKALPALPISIALGVVFYFLTRLLMEPFVVGAATNLLMF